MSGIFTSPNTPDYLDPEAARKTASPTQIVAVYDTNCSAEVARDALIAAGIAKSAIHVIDRAEAPTAKRRQDFWTAVGSLFARAEDPSAYHLAADNNHALVVLAPTTGMDLQRAMQVLSSSRPVWIYPALRP